MNNLKSGLRVELKRQSGLEPGIYRARVENAEERMGPSGSPYINLTYNLSYPNGRPTSTKVWDILSMSEKARFKIDQFLDAVNAPNEGTVDLGWFRGKAAWVQVDEDFYQGTRKLVIKQYLTEDVAEKRMKEQDMDFTTEVSSDDFDLENEDTSTMDLANIPDELAGDDEEEEFPE